MLCAPVLRTPKEAPGYQPPLGIQLEKWHMGRSDPRLREVYFVESTAGGNGFSWEG